MLHHTIAYEILKAFEKHFRLYSRITRDAQLYFEQARWKDSQSAVKQRISIYEGALADVVSVLYHKFEPRTQDHQFWRQLKLAYINVLADHPQYELAETFYNSVIGRLFTHSKIDDEVIFLLPSRCYLPGQQRQKVVNQFTGNANIALTMGDIFASYQLNIELANRDQDVRNIVSFFAQNYADSQFQLPYQVDMLKPVFYRNKGAYLIGRISGEQGSIPFVVALMLDENKQLYVDAILTSRRDLSVLFGFARSYFLVDSQYPAEVVAFLQELLPNKKHFELYTAIGFYKHGKTVFYRNFLQHLETSQDLFEAAPGIPGLVMEVFHLPSYGVVFKIIKDEFPESKKITRERVVECYRLVKMHDRVGRMADTHEFANFRLPLNRISPELLDELQRLCKKSIEIQGDTLLIKHLYIERKMTPLNLYLQQETDPHKTELVIQDLGFCIKEIAAARIFPGDMLHKNFGVTRHGRVIFYDYDEICYMHERQFRDLPKNDDPYAVDTLSVGPEDVFPEQFEHFIVGKKAHKDILKHHHPELMQPEYWRSLQRSVGDGEIKEVQPYPPQRRFQRN